MQEQQVLMLSVDEVFPDVSQPRQTFTAEDEERMAASIAARGVLQPIRVRHTDHGWIIVSGEYRWRGAKRAGLTVIPCLAVEGDRSEIMILEDQIVENVARNALRPLELARSLAKLKAATGRNSQTLAHSIGMSGASITRLESLLTLPPVIQAMVDDGKVPESSAYELSRHPDAGAQLELAHAIAAGQMNRDQVAEAVRSRIGKKQVQPKGGRVSCRLENGMSISVSSPGQTLTWDDLLTAIDRLKKEAKKLYENGKDVTDLARSLRLS